MSLEILSRLLKRRATLDKKIRQHIEALTPTLLPFGVSLVQSVDRAALPQAARNGVGPRRRTGIRVTRNYSAKTLRCPDCSYQTHYANVLGRHRHAAHGVRSAVALAREAHANGNPVERRPRKGRHGGAHQGYTLDQKRALVATIEAEHARGVAVKVACRRQHIHNSLFYRWRTDLKTAKGA